MRETTELNCPTCNGAIIDTREIVQPYSDFDNYSGFRCSNCKQEFADHEIITQASEKQE